MSDGFRVKGTAAYALAKACKAHRASVGALLAEHGLHVGQEMVLLELWEEDGLRGGELAARLGVEPPTVTKMLRRLEACGLVQRRPDPADARSFRVFVTRQGRTLEDAVARCWRVADERLVAGMSAEEAAELRRLLIRARSNLESVPGAVS